MAAAQQSAADSPGIVSRATESIGRVTDPVYEAGAARRGSDPANELDHIESTASRWTLMRAVQILVTMLIGLYAYGAAARGRDPAAETRRIQSGQMTSDFTRMIQIAVTLAVGVLIVGQIFAALPSTTGPLSNASDQVESLTGTAFELAPIVLVVIVAALVIGVVRRI